MKPSKHARLALAVLGIWLLAAQARAAVYSVTLAADPGNTWTANTLRWAAAQANLNPGLDFIDISLHGTEGNVVTVSGSPILFTDPVDVYGYEMWQTTVSGQKTQGVGLVLGPGSDHSTLQHLAIVDFNDQGIQVFSGGNSINACRIGTTWNDDPGHGNGTNSNQEECGLMFCAGSAGNSVYHSVISGNNPSGIYSNGTTGLVVKNCIIGLRSNGHLVLSNFRDGILLEDDGLGHGCTDNVIGGNYETERNVISGNSGAAVCIRNGRAPDNTVTGSNWILGNIIGMAADLSGRQNNLNGVKIQDSSGNRVGSGSQSYYHNVIAGNSQAGVVITATSPARRAANNQVQNNEIGVANNTSYNQLSILCAGVYLDAESNLVGGDRAAGSYDGNVISGFATGFGVSLGAGANGNTISGNLLGTDTSGSVEIQNATDVYVAGGGYNLIGGCNAPSVLRGNVISGFGGRGVEVNTGEGNSICGNLIGLNLDGTAGINTKQEGTTGILLGPGASNTLIGGGSAGYANVIALGQGAGPATVGISVGNTLNTVVAGNLIGTSANGLNVLNNGIGVNLGYSSCRVGGLTSGERNLICGTGSGICIGPTAAEGQGNTIAGNWIGVLAGGAVPALASDRLRYGLEVIDAQGNVAGLRNNPDSSNLIAGADIGIYVQDNCADNGFFHNTICAFSDNGIYLNATGNHKDTRPAPVISSAAASQVSGVCAGDADYVQVFLAEPRPGQAGGSLRLIGAATASGGAWTASVSGVSTGDYVCALSTDADNNTTEFSINYQIPTPAATPTPTPTLTIAATATCTPTRTITLTSTPSPVLTATPTRTMVLTNTISPTATPTPTATTSAIASLGAGAVRAFPNPARDRVTFILGLDRAARVNITLYNLAGERVAAMAGEFNSGTASLVWDCGQAAPGIYLARIMEDGVEKAKLKVALERRGR